jgi:hypothetical protein
LDVLLFLFLKLRWWIGSGQKSLKEGWLRNVPVKQSHHHHTRFAAETLFRADARR